MSRLSKILIWSLLVVCVGVAVAIGVNGCKGLEQAGVYKPDPQDVGDPVAQGLDATRQVVDGPVREVIRNVGVPASDLWASLAVNILTAGLAVERHLNAQKHKKAAKKAIGGRLTGGVAAGGQPNLSLQPGG